GTAMLHALLLSALTCLPAAGEPVQADYVLRGAMLHDGSGKAPVRGDLAIRGERIVAVGTFAPAGKPRIIPAEGLIVAPGFIDLHTHSDDAILEPATRSNLNYLTQGVTTIVTGNCGFGPVDTAAYYRKIDEHKAGSNVLHQVPHGAVRKQVMGNFNRPPNPRELQHMKELVDQGM